jgi:hypothetical protein
MVLQRGSGIPETARETLRLKESYKKIITVHFFTAGFHRPRDDFFWEGGQIILL